jgi:hypothetical protein
MAWAAESGSFSTSGRPYFSAAFANAIILFGKPPIHGEGLDAPGSEQAMRNPVLSVSQQVADIESGWREICDQGPYSRRCLTQAVGVDPQQAVIEAVPYRVLR